jgi:hypothetical protein
MCCLLPVMAVYADDSNDMVMPSRLPPPVLDSLPGANSKLLAGASMSLMSGSNQVDVLFLYADDSLRLYGNTAGVQSRITQIVNNANTAYSNSGIDINLNTVGQQFIYYDNGNTTATAFNHLTNRTHPAFLQVSAWRMQTHADIVVLLRPQKSDASTCGKAYLNGGGLANPESTFWTMGGYAYAHVSINCYDFVLAHELGHIMGLVHNRTENNSRPYLYGAGYRITNNFSTVMASTKAYPPPPTALPVPYFASPDFDCTGYINTAPCGITHTLPTGANAVLAINNIAAQIPMFSNDSDLDGMPDWFEHFWGLDRFNASDADTDADNDGLSNIGEFLSESYAKPITGLPSTSDTDGDGVLDGVDPLPTIAGSPVFDLNNFYSGSRLNESIQP